MAMQLAVLLHTADHGVLEHSHFGEQCEECIFAKKQSTDAASSFILNVSLSEYKILHNINNDVVFSNKPTLIPPVRGPPVIS